MIFFTGNANWPQGLPTTIDTRFDTFDSFSNISKSTRRTKTTLPEPTTFRHGSVWKKWDGAITSHEAAWASQVEKYSLSLFLFLFTPLLQKSNLWVSGELAPHGNPTKKYLKPKKTQNSKTLTKKSENKKAQK